ncbi:MAG TPA: ABC transporter permease [Gemmatimonadaceae bacterium]|nr:ABC transporter permease [Gemmatimonadaceae bacterium]
MKQPRFLQLPWRSRSRIALDIDLELTFHIEMRVSELLGQGLDRRAAEEQARAEFGDLEFTRAYCRTMDESTDRTARFADHVADWRQDARYAVRTLRRNAGFAVASLLTLALALGANTAVFSVAHGVLLAPLPYGKPDALVALYEAHTSSPSERNPLAPANFFDFRSQQRAFTGIAAYSGAPFTWLPKDGDPQYLYASSVTPNMFDVLAVRALHGRTFVAGDDAPGKDQVVLSYGFWQRALGGNPAVVGERMTLSGRAYDIIGVMPRGFTLGVNEDLWVPMDLSDATADLVRARKQHYLRAIARVRDGTTLAAAQADLRAIARRLETTYPESNTGLSAATVPLHEAMTGRLRTSLLLLQAAAAMVLLIACANIANLTLSRTMGRRREMALRAALGAGQGRLVRQLLAESMLLAVVGGALGVGVAVVATRTMLALNPDTLPSMFRIAVDGRVLVFSLILSVGIGAVVGIVPALDVARTDPHDSLKEGERGTSQGRRGERVRRALVVAQVGLAVVLLIGAGLLVRSFRELTRVNLGFDPDGVMTAQLRAGGERYDSAAAVNRFYDRVLDDISHAPGVVAVGGITMLPTRGSIGSAVRVEGEPVDERSIPEIRYIAVRGDAFKALRIPLKSGRDYDASDIADGPKTVIINEAAERRFFPRGDALGRRIRIGPNPNGTPMTIIGVVGDIREDGYDVPAPPTLFANHRQETWERSVAVVIRTSGDESSAAAVFRRAVRSADPTLAVRDVRSLNDVIGSSLAPRRFALGLVSSFAGIALLLATIGIYGVLSYAVASRTREFGVRLALGASERNVLMLVLRQGFAWSIVGLALGLIGALASGRLVSHMLYGIQPVDPVTYGAVVVGLTVVVTVACLVPSLRATRVDPLTSMRVR